MACIWISKIIKEGQKLTGTSIQPGTRDRGRGTREQQIQTQNEK
jgi:hypothetical protein